jgi:hypothetical protein
VHQINTSAHLEKVALAYSILELSKGAKQTNSPRHPRDGFFGIVFACIVMQQHGFIVRDRVRP